MQNCDLTLVKMGWAKELNNSETFLKVIDRLPQYLQMQWAERAESILKLGKRPRFSDLTKLVQDKADVANNMFRRRIPKISQEQRCMKFQGNRSSPGTKRKTYKERLQLL